MRSVSIVLTSSLERDIIVAILYFFHLPFREQVVETRLLCLK